MHVHDLDLLDHTHRGGEGERGAGLVGVDVHLHGAGRADHEERVAELQELGLEAVGVDRVSLDEERRAVAEGGELLVDRLRRELLEDGRGLGQLLAADVEGDPAHDLEQARAARIHDPGLLEDVQLLGRRLERLLSVSHELGERVLERNIRAGQLLGALGQRPRHAQDRPLLRVAHGGVAGVARGPQGPRQHVEVEAAVLGQLGEEAARQLREDDAGVAAGAHEDRPPDVRAGVAVERVRDRAHGQRHVRAGVPIGDGIDVEVVDARAARLERGQRRADERYSAFSTRPDFRHRAQT